MQGGEDNGGGGGVHFKGDSCLPLRHIHHISGQDPIELESGRSIPLQADAGLVNGRASNIGWSYTWRYKISELQSDSNK